MKKVSLLFLLVVPFLSSCNSNQMPDLGEKVESRTLEIFALNDFHGSFMYDEDQEQTGFSKIGNYLINAKESDPKNTFIISSGDMFQGGPESNITRGEILIEAMNEIGFDAMTVGNHEFDWGEDALKEMESKMDFPLLCINAFYANTEDRPEYFLPSTYIEKEGIRVGIIGSIYQNIASSILPTIASKYNFVNAIDLIKAEAERLRYSDYCDIVLLSTHDGQSSGYSSLVNEKDSSGNNYIDALLLGHDHEAQTGFLDSESKVPYVEGACNGEYLSHISLNLKLGDNNRYYVDSSEVENIDTFDTFKDDNPKIDAIYDQYADEIEPIRDEVLFEFDESVPALKFGEFIAKSLLDYVNSLNKGYTVSLGAINAGEGVRSDVPSGVFTYGDLIKVYPFENTLCILKINPSDYMFRYYSNNSLIKATYNDQMTPVVNDDGYVYIATIDYIAYQIGYPKEELFSYPELTCRDIVAENLRVLNEEGGSVI